MEIKRDGQSFFAISDSGEQIGRIDFPLTASQTWTVTHTFVEPAYNGQGIASKLMQAVVDAANEEAVELKATCSYAVAWLKRKGLGN